MRVACAQYALHEGDPVHNLERSLHFIERAATKGAGVAAACR
jgi:predicted amidohydrolase